MRTEMEYTISWGQWFNDG